MFQDLWQDIDMFSRLGNEACEPIDHDEIQREVDEEQRRKYGEEEEEVKRRKEKEERRKREGEEKRKRVEEEEVKRRQEQEERRKREGEKRKRVEEEEEKRKRMRFSQEEKSKGGKGRGGKQFWSKEETKEVWERFKPHIKRNSLLGKNVLVSIVKDLRAGRWLRFTDEQVRAKVRNLEKRLWE